MPAKKRVLCIDDHVDTCALVSTILDDFEISAEHSQAGVLRQAANGEIRLNSDRLLFAGRNWLGIVPAD